MKLSVNIDHAATLRQARGGSDPSLLAIAKEVALAGAHGITVHIRQDQRHIQVPDLHELKNQQNLPLNIESSVHAPFIHLLCELKPSLVTLVPESPEEITTQGGLNLQRDREGLEKTISILKTHGIKVSLFIDPSESIVNEALSFHPDAIEINTNEYAQTSSQSDGGRNELQVIRKVASQIRKSGCRVLAGHGLTKDNVLGIGFISHIEELNIGHAIIARSLFIGITQATQEILGQIPAEA